MWICFSANLPVGLFCDSKPDTLYPSVQCGLEMAILGALANANNCSIGELLNCNMDQKHFKKLGLRASRQEMNDASIRICALMDSYGTPTEMALFALNLVKQGFCTLKIKVEKSQEIF